MSDNPITAAATRFAQQLQAFPALMPTPFQGGNGVGNGAMPGLSNPLTEYMVDAAQRTVLFWDIVRQRGNQFIEHNKKDTPNVLSFDGEIVLSGLDLPRPVNYGLVRIMPPEGVTVDPSKRPIVVIDPRAGHLAGIGGFKADSEIGYGMRAGHACYLIGFLPNPVEGQTLEDVMRAEVAFLEKVVALHPNAKEKEKPFVIGNCQGGWALMMVAAYRPDLCGPLLLAGAPLSYWAGVHGKNPMRYSGGMLGGTWLTRLTSDLGNGVFDGAWLVANFEGMNPANTLWSKQYNVYRRADTERDRYLGFEQYWGGYALLNADEIQFIVDKLFVGNKLPTGGVTTSDGVRLDYRKVKSPIICFCSWGDNITPPQQALGWILDLYKDLDDIRACGQTIVYAIHDTIGHLGIFVSGSVAKKEHQELVTNIDFIDVLAPGLYEAVLTHKDPGTAGQELSPTEYIARFEPRTLDDIRALGTNDLEDERRFEAVSRLSDVNNAIYQLYAQPMVRSLGAMIPQEPFRAAHPNRFIYTAFSDDNPMMSVVKNAAEAVRQNRRPVDGENPIWKAQEAASDAITRSLDQYREMRDGLIEQTFLATFGNPFLQAALGMGLGNEVPRPRPGTDPAHRDFVEEQIEKLSNAMSNGGTREALMRAVVYVAMSDGQADERRFAILRELMEEDGGTVEDLKRIGREQFFMLQIDEDRAVEAIGDLVGPEPEERKDFIQKIRAVCQASGEITKGRATRIARIAKLLGQK